MNKDTGLALDAVFDITATTDMSIDTAIVPVEVLPANIASPPEQTIAERQANEDFEFSRGALKSVAVEAQSILHRAVEVAEQTDTPRSFEAVGDLVRATLESHRELQNLHKTAADIRLTTKPLTPANQVNIDKGIVFNGSPDELLKLIDPSRQ